MRNTGRPVLSTTLKSRFIAAVRRALGQFLLVPIVVVLAFVALDVVAYVVDEAWSQGNGPANLAWLGKLMGDRQAINGLLTTIASSIITVTSITFSLLLIAVQQGASSLTAQVTDQFLMRRTNQFYFGFFVGLSVFTLLMLVTDSSFHRPVVGTAIALVMTTVALCLIVLMIYNTIDQMRPARIVQAIHEYVLCARAFELRLLAATRREPRREWPVVATLRSPDSGHLVALRVAALDKALRETAGAAFEATLIAPIGTRLAVGDPVVVVRGDPHDAAARTAAERGELPEPIAAAIEGALVFDDGRDLKRDAAYGLYQLTTIAWTSVSTAKSNPSPGQAIIHSLRDIVARWSVGADAVDENRSSLIVLADGSPAAALDALETIALVSSESMQAQTLADALRTLAILLGEVNPATAMRLADICRRSLSCLGEHVLTQELEAALATAARALRGAGFAREAVAMDVATRQLAHSLGRLGSRSTRVPPPLTDAA